MVFVYILIHSFFFLEYIYLKHQLKVSHNTEIYMFLVIETMENVIVTRKCFNIKRNFQTKNML